MRSLLLPSDNRSILAIVISLSLVFSIVTIIIPQQNVLADKPDNNKGKSKNSDDPHKAKKRWIHFVEKSAKEKHKENLNKHKLSGPYPADTEYTLTATGTATPISGGGSEAAKISMDLSIWKSTKGLVAMDIMDGTVKIGDDTHEIFSGHAFYFIRGGHMLVFAFIVEDDGSGSEDKHISLLKLWAKTQKGDSLPLSDSDSSLKLDILSPQSKLVSEYFLDMDGQLTFGSTGGDGDDNGPIPQPSKGAEIVTSADSHGKKFFGDAALQVLISNKNAVGDEITVTIKAEGDGNDTANITIPNTNAGSKKFEFFMVHANADCDNGSCIEKPLTVGSIDDEQVVTFGYGGELDTADEDFDQMSFTITYGDKKVGIEHKDTKGSIELDRATYGSDSTMHLFINDQDANLDPTAVDSFVVQENNVEELFTLDEEITLPDDIDFTETANNTARFGAVLHINDKDSDEDAEIIIDEGAGPFLMELLDIVDYDDLGSDANNSTEIDSVNFSIDDKDGSIVKSGGDITFASELKLTIKDNDQNKDSAKVDVLEGALTVEIEGGDSEELDLRETSANSGEFAIDNANKLLALTFTEDDSPEDDNGLLEFISNEIEDDIVITYSDPLNEEGADEEIQLELQLTTKEGTIALPSSVDIEGDLAVTLTDADLNDDVTAKESYSFNLTGDEPVPLENDDFNLQDFAAIEVRINDDNVDFDNPETYTLVETGLNTGVFIVSIDLVELAESAGVEDSLENGDTIEFTYIDRMEEPDEENSDIAELD